MTRPPNMLLRNVSSSAWPRTCRASSLSPSADSTADPSAGVFSCATDTDQAATVPNKTTVSQTLFFTLSMTHSTTGERNGCSESGSSLFPH